jgi:hypothetical protein
MTEQNRKPFSNNWVTLADLVRFNDVDDGQGGKKQQAKGMKLSVNDGNLFAQTYEGDKRITLKLAQGEALTYAFAIIKHYLK